MASCSENTATKPQAIQPSSAQEHIQTQKNKEERPMADTSIISGDVENSSSKPRSHREGGKERHPPRDHHRFGGGQRKRLYQHRYRDQGAYHDRKGRQQYDQQEERHQQKGVSQEKASNRSETVKGSETPHGTDGTEAASSGAVSGHDRDKMDSQETEQGEGGQSKRGRNRGRQRKRGGRKEDEPATMSQNESERSSKNKMDNTSEASKESNPPADEGDSHRGRGGGATSAGGRRPRRSERDQQQWRSEQRQRPPRGEGRRYYHNNRDYWRGEERRDSPWRHEEKRNSLPHDQQRSCSKNDSSKKDVLDEQEGATCSNFAGDHEKNRNGDTQVEITSKPTSNSTKPESERKTVEKADRHPQSSKPKSYDYTKPCHSGNDRPSSSKYKGRSQHHLKTGNKEFTPTIQSDELSQQLTAETYECMVCCDRVRERDQIWSCQNCYHIFHLKCIKKWATAPTFASTEEGQYLLVCMMSWAH